MRSVIKAFSLGWAVFSSALNLSAQAQTPTELTPYLATDLRDLNELLRTAPNGLGRFSEKLIAAVETHSRALFGTHLTRQRATQTRQAQHLFGMQLEALPDLEGTAGQVVLWIDVRLQTQLTFHRVRLGFDGVGTDGSLDAIAVHAAERLESIPAERVSFQGEVDLYRRQVLFTSPQYPTLRRLFPLGVGMLDEGVTIGSVVDGKRTTRLVTPEFDEVYLRRQHVIARRPGSFLNRPFMALSSPSQHRYHLAFHITQNPGLSDPALLTQVNRGFVSAGCLHLREFDLYSLFHWLQSGGSEELPLRMKLQTQQPWQHPYPYLNHRYRRVRNFGTAQAPASRRRASQPGGYAYRVTEWIDQAPPTIDQITPVDGNHMNDAEFQEYSWPLQELELPRPGQPPAAGAVAV